MDVKYRGSILKNVVQVTLFDQNEKDFHNFIITFETSELKEICVESIMQLLML